MEVKKFMRKMLLFTITVICALIFFISDEKKLDNSYAAEDGYYTIAEFKAMVPDPYVQQRILQIWKYTDKPDTYKFYKNAFTNISTLQVFAPDGHVVDLTGLEKFTNITYLHISGKIKSLKPINAMTKLVTFSNTGDINRYSHDYDLSFKDIPNLTNLSSIEFYYVDIATLDGIDKLTNLHYLDLTGCSKISDLSPLAKSTNLTGLDISSCWDIRDLSVLAKLPNLKKFDANSCNITDISSLKNKTTMTELYLVGCEDLFESAYISKTMDTILSLSNLEILSLRSTGVGDTQLKQVCNKLPKLTKLILLNNNITSLSGIEKLQKLTTLEVGDNKISDFSPMSSLPNLVSNCLNYSEDATRVQIVSVNQKGNLVKNPFKDFYGNPVVFESNENFTYNKADNTIQVNTTGKVKLGVMPIKLEKDTVKQDLYINCSFEPSEITINKQPLDVVCTAGAPITLSVSATAENSKLQYQWYKGDVKIADGTSATYTIPESELSDAGSYKCVINGYMTTATTREAKVTVNKPTDKVVIVKQPGNVTCYEKESFTLTVKATSLDSNYTYKWYKDGVLLTNEKTNTITVKNASFSDSGKYKCEVSNAESKAMSNEAKVEVKEKIYIEPPTQKPNEIESTTVEVVVEETTTNEFQTEETTTEETTSEELTSEIETTTEEETTLEESSSYEEDTTEEETTEAVVEEETTSDNNSGGQGKSNLLIYFIVGLIILFIIVAIILFIFIFIKRRNDENENSSEGALR